MHLPTHQHPQQESPHVPKQHARKADQGPQYGQAVAKRMTSPHFLADSFGGLMSPVSAFMTVMILSFLLCLFVGIRNDTVSEFFSASRNLSTGRNALALCGDWVPTSALLGAVSAVAVGGFDGILVAVSLAAAPAVLVILAEPLRATDSFTLGAVLARRFPGSRTRIAAAAITVAICVPMTVIQLTVAGDAAAYILDVESEFASQVCTVMIGTLIITFAAFGGMRGTSIMQIIKIVLLLFTLLVLVNYVLRQAGWGFATIFERAGQQSGDSQSYYSPGQLYGDSSEGILDVLSLCVGVALGSAVLPHVVMRVNVFRDGRSVRRGLAVAAVVLSAFSFLTVLAGLSAAGVIGSKTLVADDQENLSALFQLSESLGGETMGDTLLTLVSCAVFVAALSTTSGLTLAIGSLAHDFSEARRSAESDEGREINLARWFIIGSGALSLFLAVQLHSWSIAPLTSFVFSLGASTVLPALVYSLLWKKFTQAGLYATLYGSLGCCLFLQVLSLSVSGSPVALLSGQDFHWLPLQHIALLSVPVGFLLGWAVSAVQPAESRRTSTPAS
ncbi:sodium/solute symporter [Streptomyces spongiae]|uniref:Cation acetate symporter n=1 Tax=Streptomyces spongiae TaxID=565072 RepID=A0A5N8X9V1_9ACTN|nr:cation acetate symporter [Streptomyces spongiae]MPY55924.1 cation acetate symporter [Streptomyces spongiae]